MQNEIVLTATSVGLFVYAVLTRRFGFIAGLLMLGLLVYICVVPGGRDSTFGVAVTIALFTLSLVLHGRFAGKNSLLIRYNPYSPHSRLSWRLRLAILAIAFLVSVMVFAFLLA